MHVHCMYTQVYPSAAPDALEASARVPLPLIDELHAPGLAGRWKWKIPAGVRDFPCGWDMMVENTPPPASNMRPMHVYTCASSCVWHVHGMYR